MQLSPRTSDRCVVTPDSVEAAYGRKASRYDKSGEEHYNIISAFIKSMRGSDPNAALYWVILGVGVALLVLLLVGVVVYLFLTVKAIALSQRQSNFIDSVTHELKSPLASLKLYLQTLTRRPVPPEQQADFHRFMLKDVERLDQLIDHLLDAAKTVQRRPRGGDEATAVEPIVRAARDAVAIRYRIDPALIRLVGLAPPGPKVRGRQADLEIVFRNLVDNAVKYSMPAPEVEIAAETRGREVVVRVTDNGPGIAPADRTKIFGPFFTTKVEGMGLGLSFCRTVAEQHGDTLVFKPNEPQGTVFSFALPVA